MAVFGSAQTEPGSDEWIEAEETGARLAQAGHAVITGGYGGTMEAASKGAVEAGGHTIGVIAPLIFPGRSGANPYVVEVIEAATIPERIGVMMGRAAAVIAMPGSMGTATELVLAWNINHVARRNGGTMIPTVAVGPAWGVVADTLIDQIGAGGTDVYLVASPADGVEWVLSKLDSHGV